MGVGVGECLARGGRERCLPDDEDGVSDADGCPDVEPEVGGGEEDEL